MSRNFYVEKIQLFDPSVVEARLEALLNQELKSVAELESWLQSESQLLETIDEAMTGHAIEFECHNDDDEIRARFEHDQSQIMPLLNKYTALLNQKFFDSPYRKQLDGNKYRQLTRSKVSVIELFREENLPLQVALDKLVTQYSTITGALTVDWNGEEKTIPQMQPYLKSPDRSIRERAWRGVTAQLLGVRDEIDAIMDDMVKLRHQMAVNAGFENFRDYMFKKYERFDYTPADCFVFHEAVRKYVVPLKDGISASHQRELGVEQYRPWDELGVPANRQPLQPFSHTQDLIAGVIRIYERTDDLFAQVMKQLRDHHLLDLDSRKAKTPGGFMAPLFVTGLSFIFMNAAGSQDDVSTLLHEGGHAVHGALSNAQPFMAYKNTPMESAEFASMSMELLTMDKWDEFYEDAESLRRAQREQLEGIIKFLPWAMVVDRFQHWLYENPGHTGASRHQKFAELAREFSHHYTDWTDLEAELLTRWHVQGHIFSDPFYYIEYAIAQLAAVQLWKQYTEDPAGAIANYKRALALGGSKPLPEVYEAAGIRFDFSESLIRELMAFTKARLDRLQ